MIKEVLKLMWTGSEKRRYAPVGAACLPDAAHWACSGDDPL